MEEEDGVSPPLFSSPLPLLDLHEEGSEVLMAENLGGSFCMRQPKNLVPIIRVSLRFALLDGTPPAVQDTALMMDLLALERTT